MKNLKSSTKILGFSIILMFTVGIFLPAFASAYLDSGGGGGGGTTYYATRSATKSSTKTVTKTVSQTVTKTYDEPHTVSRTATASRTATITASATKSSTKTRSSTVSQSAADSAAQSAADSAAQSAADSAATATATIDAGVAAQSAANSAAFNAVATAFADLDSTAILIHGWGPNSDTGASHEFSSMLSRVQADSFFENAFSIDYYYHSGDSYAQSHTEQEFYDYGVTTNTHIGTVASLLKDYLIRMHDKPDTDPERIRDNLYIFAHSMGGLVSRYMVKHYYNDLKSAGINIRHIAMFGTPNFGCLIGAFGFSIQSSEMSRTWFQEAFLDGLALGDRTPCSWSDSVNSDIYYTTYTGGADFIGTTDNVALDDRFFWWQDGYANDVTNFGLYDGVNHGQLLTDLGVYNDAIAKVKNPYA